MDNEPKTRLDRRQAEDELKGVKSVKVARVIKNFN